MRNPWIRQFVLLWLLWWFGLYLPGHQRGTFVLPGTQSSSVLNFSDQPSISALSSDCCFLDGNDERAAPGDRSVPSPRPAGRCAVCHLAMLLIMPPPVDLGHQYLTMAERAAFHQPAIPILAAPISPILQRGPPTICPT